MSCGREPKAPQPTGGKGEDEKMKDMPVKRDEKGNVIVPKGFIYQPEVRDADGKIKAKEYYRRHGYKKKKREPIPPEKPKRKYIRRPWYATGSSRRAIRQQNPEPDPIMNPVTKATPAEILIALRKGMAAEIVEMIKEKYDL